MIRPSLTRTAACLALAATAALSTAQVATFYTTSTDTRTWSPITGGQLIAATTFDDVVYQVMVPSVFFNGTYYTELRVSTNGFITLGGPVPGATNYIPISGSGGYAGAIAPFATNLKNATSGTPEVRWQLVNDEVVVQWLDVARATGGTERFSFQARMNRVTGVISFRYSAVTSLNADATNQPQVGLRGPNNTFATNVKNLMVGTGAETWAAPLSGTANSSTMRFTATAPAKSPAGNEAFTFTPNCVSPVANTTAVSNCATNNFMVTVHVTSLGTASGVNIVASPGGTLHSNVGVGDHLCGPFTLGTPVTFSVVNTLNNICTNVLPVVSPTPTCITHANGTCYDDAPQPVIPDDGCSNGSNLQATIPISGVGTTLGPMPGNAFFQSVELIIAHTFRGDLEVYLTSPTGQKRTMLLHAPTADAEGSNFGNPGSCPSQVLQLRDTGGQPQSSMSPTAPNLSGIYTPVQSLGGFTGNPNGNWVLTICDGHTQDEGTLRFARLRILNVDCVGVPGGATLPGVVCNDGNPNTINDVYNANCQCVGTPTGSGVDLNVKAVLEGPYVAGTGLMNDAMRAASLIPATEPYTALGLPQIGGGGETVAPSVLAVTGNNAVVDWVRVELRSSGAPATIIATRQGLLQRDGDITATDGTSALSFSGVSAGNYYVALRHRNHLGIMTSAAIALGGGPTTVDFRSVATTTYGTNARKSITGTFPAQALWAGDATSNGQVKYTGSSNDRDPLLTTVGSTTPNATVNGYSTRDVNLNGQVKYTGSANDRDPILINVGSTTPNATRSAQLP